MRRWIVCYAGLEHRSFRNRDEQEVAGYAEAMELVFASWPDIAEAATLARANRNTLKLHLRQLVQTSRLRLRGRGRRSWYELQ